MICSLVSTGLGSYAPSAWTSSHLRSSDTGRLNDGITAAAIADTVMMDWESMDPHECRAVYVALLCNERSDTNRR